MHLIVPPTAATPRRREPRAGTGAQCCLGFTLVEMMVAITLGLLVVAALTTVFVSGSRGRTEIEQASRQMESGRYATQLLSDDLRQAGYFAEFDPRVLAAPATKPDPCATDLGTLKTALPLQIQGYDASLPSAIAALGCLADVRAGSDVLVVRRTSSCVAGAAGCDALVPGAPYFQASLCYNPSELEGPVSGWYGLDANTGTLGLHQKDCTTVADLHRYLTRIYFVASDNVAGDGVPTLKMAELGASGFSVVPLVDGIENMQIEYGIDTDLDGAPDAYTDDPDTYNGCAGVACTTNWRNVVTAKLYLLARTVDASPGYGDGKVYALGSTTITPGATYYAGGAAPCDAAATCYPVGYRRHVFQTDVRLINVSGRNSTP